MCVKITDIYGTWNIGHECMAPEAYNKGEKDPGKILMSLKSQWLKGDEHAKQQKQ